LIRRTARGNRVGLAVVGVVLMVLGGLAIARGLGLLAQEGAPADRALVDEPLQRAFAQYDPLLGWAVAVAAALITLLGLRWLLAQGRGDSVRGIRLAAGPEGVTDVESRGIAQAVAQEVADHPDVISATAALTGREEHPGVRLRVVADERTRIDDLREHVGGVAVPHMREALDTERVPTVTHVTLKERTGERALQ
jgi:hypothetical protein